MVERKCENMMGFKRVSALMVAGVIGITYTCSGVPVIYAMNGKNTSYYTVESGFATVMEEGITTLKDISEMEDAIKTVNLEGVMGTEFPMETATQGAVMETKTPEETMFPGNTKPPFEEPAKTPVIPVHTEESVKTSSPITTFSPEVTDIPIKTTLPINTTTAPSNNTATTEKPDSNINEQYCRITYQLNGGKNHKNNPIKVKKKGVSVVLNAPSKAKYTFVGWYTDTKYTNKVTTVGNTSLSFLTLYAKWKKVTVKQVMFSVVKKKGTDSILVKVKKENGVKGFEYVYAKDSCFKRKYRLRTKKNPKTLSKLTKKKTYYIKVRAYKLDSTGKKIYGTYSRIRKVKL